MCLLSRTLSLYELTNYEVDLLAYSTAASIFILHDCESDNFLNP